MQKRLDNVKRGVRDIPVHTSGKLNEEFCNEILVALKPLCVSSILIHYESGARNTPFMHLLYIFLEKEGYRVFVNPEKKTEIKRNEFSVRKHESNPNVAVLKIGSRECSKNKQHD